MLSMKIAEKFKKFKKIKEKKGNLVFTYKIYLGGDKYEIF